MHIYRLKSALTTERARSKADLSEQKLVLMPHLTELKRKIEIIDQKIEFLEVQLRYTKFVLTSNFAGTLDYIAINKGYQDEIKILISGFYETHSSLLEKDECYDFETSKMTSTKIPEVRSRLTKQFRERLTTVSQPFIQFIFSAEINHSEMIHTLESAIYNNRNELSKLQAEQEKLGYKVDDLDHAVDRQLNKKIVPLEERMEDEAIINAYIKRGDALGLRVYFDTVIEILQNRIKHACNMLSHVKDKDFSWLRNYLDTVVKPENPSKSISILYTYLKHNDLAGLQKYLEIAIELKLIKSEYAKTICEYIVRKDVTELRNYLETVIKPAYCALSKYAVYLKAFVNSRDIGQLQKYLQSTIDLKANTTEDLRKELANKVLYDGNSLLHKACLYGQHTVVEYLLSIGAELFKKNIDQYCPIHSALTPIAAQDDDASVVKDGTVLVLEVLKKYCIKQIGNTEWQNKLLECKGIYDRRPLHTAAFYGDLLGACWLLSYAELEINAKTNEGGFLNTPLHTAVERGCHAIVGLLLNKGADPDLQNIRGERPMVIAVCGLQVEAIKVFILAGHGLTGEDMNIINALPIKNREKVYKLLGQLYAETEKKTTAQSTMRLTEERLIVARSASAISISSVSQGAEDLAPQPAPASAVIPPQTSGDMLQSKVDVALHRESNHLQVSRIAGHRNAIFNSSVVNPVLENEAQNKEISHAGEAAASETAPPADYAV